MDDLQELHKQLIKVMDADMANFIIAYRQGGAYDGNESGQQASSLTIDFKEPGRVKLNTILDLIGAKTRIARPNAAGQSGQAGQGTAKRRWSRRRTEVVAPAAAKARTAVSSSMRRSPTIAARCGTYLPILMENLAVNAAPSIPGRMNINQAPRRLLAGIPGLGSNAVDQIIANREVEPGVQRPEQAYETWLLTDGIVELAAMKKLMAPGHHRRQRLPGASRRLFRGDGPINARRSGHRRHANAGRRPAPLGNGRPGPRPFAGIAGRPRGQTCRNGPVYNRICRAPCDDRRV